MGIVFENSSFETGDFSDWKISGNASIEASDFGVTPNTGTQQAVIDTGMGGYECCRGGILSAFKG